MGSLEGVEGDEAITSRALAAVDDLSGKAGKQSAPGRGSVEAWLGLNVKKAGNGDDSHIGSNGSEKGLEAIVGGAVREVTSEYLQPLVSFRLMTKTSAANSPMSETAAGTSR